jgi:hypothetical protein
MKRLAPIFGGVIVFGWMAVAGAYFLAENPGALGFIADPIRAWLGKPPADVLPHNLLRLAEHLGASLGSRTFQGWPVEILGALAFSIWLFIVFLGSGLWIVRGAGLRDLPALESLAVGATLGMGAWGMGVLLLGVARLLYPIVLVGILILATTAAIPVVRDWAKALSSSRPTRPRGMTEWTAVALAALALALSLIYTLTPAIQSDGLRYHLAAPQVFLREHRIVYLPFNAFTNFPFLIEMLFTLSLAVAGDLAAKMIHFECFLLCGLFVALLLQRLLEGLETEHPKTGPRLLLLGALVFWTTPTALLTAAWEFIDLGTALFFVAMVYALVRRHSGTGILPVQNHGQDAHATTDKRRWRLIAALLLGFLIGTKYTMLAMLAVVPLALLLELLSFTPSRQSEIQNSQSKIQNLKSKILSWLRSSLFIGLVAAAVASPWFIKNIVFTRNPVYPLAWGIFDGGEWSAENARFYFDKSSLKGYHPRHDRNLGETLLHLAVTPWEATIHWWLPPDGRYHGYENQFLGPVFLLWMPLLLVVLADIKNRAAGKGPLRFVVLFAFAYCILWYFTYQSNRLLIPATALLSVLIAYSLAVAERTARRLSRATTAILLAACLYNVEWSADFIFRETNEKPSPAPYWLGLQSRDSYIRQAFPPYAMFQLMPNFVRPGQKVLFVGEYRTCHCPVEWRASDWFDTPLILHYIRTTPDNDALLDGLLNEGVAWIFYNAAELAKYEKDFFQPRFSEAEWKRYTELFAREKRAGGDTIIVDPRLRSALSQSGMYLYEILPRNPSPQR